MYHVRTNGNKNVFIKDLDILIQGSDSNGVYIDETLFDTSKDAKKSLKDLIVETDNMYKYADKHIVNNEIDLGNIKNPYEGMSVYVEDYNNTGYPCHALYLENQWKVITSGGSGGSVYIHPATHPATMIVTDSTHEFVTDTQIAYWDGKSNFSGKYSDLTGKPILFSGNYVDLTNKPIIPTKTSQLTLDNVYTKTEVDTKIASVSTGGSGGGTTTSGLVRYEATGSTNGECRVLANANGVTFSKSGNSATISAPAGVEIYTAQIYFTGAEVTGSVNIDFGSNAGTGNNTSYTDIYVPAYTVVQDVVGSRTYKTVPFPAGNLNASPHNLTISGLTSGVPVWVKLTF